ncbi:MAG: VOC family protein [Erysipelotrichaceae bacterium]
MKKLVPNLWFDGNAMEAAQFYCEVFPHGRIKHVHYFSSVNPYGEAGSVMDVEVEIMGETLILINGGPQFKFTPAISLMVNTHDEDELDRIWFGLLDGGLAQDCGWLQDRFGVSWQVVPESMMELFNSTNQNAVDALTLALLQMKKIDWKTLHDTFEKANTK